MNKKVLSILLAVIMLMTMAVPAYAKKDDPGTDPGTDTDTSILSDLNVRYNTVTKSLRVDFTLGRDIEILLAKAISDTELSAFSASTTDPMASTAIRSAGEMTDAYTAAANAYDAIGLSTYYGNFEQNLELYKQNKDSYVSLYGSIFYDSLINKRPFDQVQFDGTDYRSDRTLINQIATMYGDPASATRDLDIIMANSYTSYTDALAAISGTSDYTVKQQILSLLGDKANISFICGDSHIFDITPVTIDSLYNMDEKKPCCNFFEEIITSAKNGEDAVVTLKEGTNYGFSVELNDEQLANIASSQVCFDYMYVSDEGTYSESALKATPENQYVGISGIEDGEWVDSEEPITFTAEGVEHLISLYPCSADDSIVPVRWYLDGDKDNAVEFENGDYSGVLNHGRMSGGEHTLTVEYNHKYVDYSSVVKSFDEIQQDDSITDSLTITFTANTFKFGEVSATLLRVFEMITDIFTLLFGLIGA